MADTGNHRIVKIDRAGKVTVVAGGSDTEYGLSGDGGPATDALLYQPQAVALHQDGSLYLADTGNDRVRRVGSDGVITTVAGTGAAGFAGDGGQAAAAQLDNPTDIEIDAVGNLYIADANNYRIRKVDASGVISTFAGVADPDFGGPPDGSVAAEVSFYEVTDLAIDPAGNLYADPARIVVRIDPSGTVTHVAGDGSEDADGVPALEASFALGVSAMAIDPKSGTLYLATSTRVREIPGVAQQR